MRRTQYLSIILFLMILAFGLVFSIIFKTYYWEIIAAIPQEPRRFVKQLIKLVADVPYAHYHFSFHNLPTYELKVDSADLAKLTKQLPKNYTDIFDADSMDYVNAKFIADGKEYAVKIKYRGSTSQHWSYPKKSIRIKFKEPSMFRGMSEINLVVPESRGYLMESFNNYRARKLGLPALKDDFVNLKINWRGYGVYYLIEGWTKEFLERENKLTADSNLYGDKTFDSNLYEDIKSWQKYIANPEENENNFSDLARLLKVINEPDDEVFYKTIGTILDMDNFMKWVVHSTLSGSFHQDFKHNARIYFDPTIGKFKFIPWQIL